MSTPTLGFIGVGAMGGPMARHLLTAGYALRAVDLDGQRLAAVVAAGAVGDKDVAGVMTAADVVLVSLPSSDAFVAVAERDIVPQVRASQVIIDLGTTTVPQTRRIAALLAQKGAALLEAPVSGGPAGAERGELRIFAGGDREVLERCRPILETIGGREHIVYCGPTGCGQVVKGVNQLMMGLGIAAFVEAAAFGILGGVEPEVIEKAVGGDGWLRRDFAGVAGRIKAGEGDQIGVKFRELPYFLEAAASAGFDLPLTKLLHAFCDAGERVVVDDNRPAPSFFHELMRRHGR